jgi:predicted outer membrane repeat protein
MVPRVLPVEFHGGAIFGGNYLTDCIFAGNAALDSGGAIYVASKTWPVSADNCTFVGNRANRDGGAILCNEFGPGIRSSILRDNPPQDIVGRSPVIAFSNITGGWPGEGNIDADPCFADSGYWDPNGTPEDANDDFFVHGDYHLKSQAGRWDPNSETWVIDDVTSPCIDAGDPLDPIGHEPFPNGGIINMGAYGGTGEASKSHFGKPPCETIVAGDISGDCQINFKDFFFVALHWLADYTP